ncbi:MAG: ADP-ribosylglycohydrolase family protein [Gammaproteobacteria bacterium]
MKNSPTHTERISGALMGAFIGDALGLGPHWYYDLEELQDKYGSWIDNYTDPKPDHYHAGMKAGQSSQSGIILRLLVQSLIDQNGYDETKFCQLLDENLFPLLDGTPEVGPGSYTSQSIRETYDLRVRKKYSWGDVAGFSDTTESAERTLALAIRYAFDPGQLADSISSNTLLFQKDEIVVAMTVAYGATLGLLIQGHSFDNTISSKLMGQVKSGELPFHAVSIKKSAPPGAGRFSSPDALLTPSNIAAAAVDKNIIIEPASKVALVFGLPCAVYHQIPAAYYLAARFKDNFELAVLHAINGGGQNMSRAMLTGALVGAQTGIQGIPERFIDGLEHAEDIYNLALQLAGDSAI